MRLTPQGRFPILIASSPALGQVGQIGERDGQAGLAQDGEDALARPQHHGRSPVGAIERSPLVTGRLVEFLFVGIQIVEGIGR